MGLTASSVGNASASDIKFINKDDDKSKVIALVGNPNVGKSTVFNALTGMKQHTGNWTGKTVTGAKGEFKYKENNFILVDTPGTYSLIPDSEEEKATRDFVCFGGCDGVLIVCDACSLERNLVLLFQVLEVNKNVVLCVNLMDEAKKKGIHVDTESLEKELKIKVVPTEARKGVGIEEIKIALSNIRRCDFELAKDEECENQVKKMGECVEKYTKSDIAEFVSTTLLSLDEKEIPEFAGKVCEDKNNTKEFISECKKIRLDSNAFQDKKSVRLVKEAEKITKKCVKYSKERYSKTDRRTDKLLASGISSFFFMLLMLFVVFYITVIGANYPSELLSKFFSFIEEKAEILFCNMKFPPKLISFLCDGVIKTVGWIVSVMLPPMAIFFPLFTLLEDWGYLPRVAFNLDRCFRKCGSCGKQSLTMCMGFGCNCAGVVGCRIISSKKERLIAVLTNSLVPCNGRFPTLIMLTTVFITGMGVLSGVFSALVLTLMISVCVAVTLIVSAVLSKTLRGEKSSFVLEMPSYRRPEIAKTLVRSVLDRTVFVLARAVMIALPAGAIIWLLSNVFIGNVSVSHHISDFLDPVAKLFGLDGVILTAFIIGIPANEIIIPIVIMSYTSSVALCESGDIMATSQILMQNGWTVKTAICFIIFFLFHSPCATTLLTVKKETGSIKYMFLSFLIPTLLGFFLCFFTNIIL